MLPGKLAGLVSDEQMYRRVTTVTLVIHPTALECRNLQGESPYCYPARHFRQQEYAFYIVTLVSSVLDRDKQANHPFLYMRTNIRQK